MHPGASKPTTSSATVIIFGGDPVVGRALELLLRTANYAAKYLAGDALDCVESPGRARVLLLSPGWDSEAYKAAVAVTSGASGAAEVTVLELGEPSDGGASDPRRHVPWPCRAEELSRRIDAAFDRRFEQAREERRDKT